ncbi:MAG TPA: hypothetical protein GXX46_08850 [Peptococcaceae bacterium]|nr:hypothetical protein [Peptococcaceae bacterium]
MKTSPEELNRQAAEERLDRIIDLFNQERDPSKTLEIELHPGSEGEGKDLGLEDVAIVRILRSLRPQAEPSPGFGAKLAKLFTTEQTGKKAAPKKNPFRIGVFAACILLVFAFTFWNNLFKGDVVLAMEKAVQKLSSYHGIMEMTTENAQGEKWLVRQVEIWYQGDKYALRQNGETLTVNNGKQKWQVRERDKEVAILPLVPDYTKQGFALRDEALRAKQYPHTIVGQEQVAGREAHKLKISPPGGEPYYLWLDVATNLPLKLQTAMQNALQTTYTFVSFEANAEINPQIFTLKVPEGFKVIEEDPGQLVATVREAIHVSEITPLLPQEVPQGIYAFPKKIVLDYGETSIIETPASLPWEPAGFGAWGELNGQPVEIIRDRLRWQQEGLEITVEGPRSLELARQIAPDMILPDKDTDLSSQAQVKVPVDMEIVRNDQKQVDAGHTPWQLDPLYVSVTFVNLLVTPEGIVGEPKIPYEDFKIGKNTGKEAIVEVLSGPVSKVYLKRLVRQDESGIWTVVGYDQR